MPNGSTTVHSTVLSSFSTPVTQVRTSNGVTVYITTSALATGTSAADSGSSSSSSHLGLGVGIGVGIGIPLLLLAIGLPVFLRRRRRASPPSVEPEDRPVAMAAEAGAPPRRNVAKSALPVPGSSGSGTEGMSELGVPEEKKLVPELDSGHGGGVNPPRPGTAEMDATGPEPQELPYDPLRDRVELP